jgi:hypothetical protein
MADVRERFRCRQRSFASLYHISGLGHGSGLPTETRGGSLMTSNRETRAARVPKLSRSCCKLRCVGERQPLESERDPVQEEGPAISSITGSIPIFLPLFPLPSTCCSLCYRGRNRCEKLCEKALLLVSRQTSKAEADAGQVDQCFARAGQAFVVFTRAAAATGLRQRALQRGPEECSPICADRMSLRTLAVACSLVYIASVLRMATDALTPRQCNYCKTGLRDAWA